MHIPDGFVDLKTVVTTSIVSAGGLGASIYKVKKIFKARTIAIMGVLAALIFALQMINFSIPGGTSGHILGGALSSIIVGPFGGSIILSNVLFIKSGNILFKLNLNFYYLYLSVYIKSVISFWRLIILLYRSYNKCKPVYNFSITSHWVQTFY
jgi:predicted neutral ceramidase superfamily lipid hydrolase